MELAWPSIFLYMKSFGYAGSNDLATIKIWVTSKSFNASLLQATPTEPKKTSWGIRIWVIPWKIENRTKVLQIYIKKKKIHYTAPWNKSTTRNSFIILFGMRTIPFDTDLGLKTRTSKKNQSLICKLSINETLDLWKNGIMEIQETDHPSAGPNRG